MEKIDNLHTDKNNNCFCQYAKLLQSISLYHGNNKLTLHSESQRTQHGSASFRVRINIHGTHNFIANTFSIGNIP